MVQTEGVKSGGPKDIGPFLTVREVSAKLRVSAATVYDLCNSGQLPQVRVNNAIRVATADLWQYLDRVGGRIRGQR